ncbi:MAG: type III toxin-antitoxin system ToxN/AbiQ family toxin [Bacilli bacterium]|jgi:protein AbiQ
MVFKLVKIDYMYCDYLRKYDKRVVYNKGKKELRPFIGVLFSIGDKEYFAPLSSPKPKHQIMKNNIDFFKIDNGTLGVINFNNMIPVYKDNYDVITLNKHNLSKGRKEYQTLLKKQLLWLNKNSDIVRKKSIILYNAYISGALYKNIYDRCCNFPLLEVKCDEYNKEKVLI